MKVFSLQLTPKTEKLEYDITGVANINDLVQAPAGNPPFYIFKVRMAVFFRFRGGVFVGLRNLAWARGWKSSDDIGSVIRKEHENS